MPVLSLLLALTVIAPGDAAASCATLSEQKRFSDALEPCREAHRGAPSSVDLTALLARAEYEDGDAAESAKLWSDVLERRGWSFADARARALALWRSGDMTAAESVFRDTAKREPSSRAYLDLGDFLLSSRRWRESMELSAEGLRQHPAECGLFEQGAVAAASLGQDEAAAGLLRREDANGCRPFRWAALTPFTERLSRPAYKALLNPSKLLDGIEGLEDSECRLRLKLLEKVATPESARPVAGVLMKRKDFEIVQRALRILESLGPAAMPAWETLFAEGDFVLRKYALRSLRHRRDAAFIPLLEGELEKERSPGNRYLAALALGELLLQRDRSRAEELLRSIPESDPLSCSAALTLALDAEKRRDYAASLQVLERMKRAPNCRLDPKLFDRVREAAASKPPPASVP